MANLYKLRNQIKHYEWGSTDLLPRLLGVAGDGSPWAELWMGSHSDLPDGVSVEQRYGALPFLFKVLAVEKPLSVQAHPNLAQAREGYERENKAQVALNAPNRNYHDPNHKPEIICALTPFTGMCGFHSPDEIKRLLSTFHACEGFTPLLRALEIPNAALALRTFFCTLFDLPQKARQALTEFILSAQGTEWELMRQLARQYPGDPAIIAPLYLALFHLEPGEAVFIDAGLPHAYVHGLGVELMTNSDNVLRGGLTAKHVDIPELLNALDFSPAQPRIIKPEMNPGYFTYPVPCGEFSLTVMRGQTGGTAQPMTGPPLAALARNSPAICIVTEGEVSVEGGGSTDIVLKQGESALIPPASGSLALRGDYTLYAASVPGQNFCP